MKRLEDKQNRNRKTLMDITEKHTKKMENLQIEFETAKTGEESEKPHCGGEECGERED